jgi:hypothetical protein
MGPDHLIVTRAATPDREHHDVSTGRSIRARHATHTNQTRSLDVPPSRSPPVFENERVEVQQQPLAHRVTANLRASWRSTQQ